MENDTSLILPHNVRIIGIIGKKRSGKTTLAKMLQNSIQQDNILDKAGIFSFATALKRVICELFDITPDIIEEYKTKPLEIYPYLTTRQLMQIIGTDLLRSRWPAIFIHSVHRDIVRTMDIYSLGVPEYNVAIIDDVRFQNEAEYVRQNGFLVKLMDGGDTCDAHISETELETIKADIHIHGWKTGNSTCDILRRIIERAREEFAHD